MSEGRTEANRKLQIVRAVRAWYRKNKRTLPWRDVQDPYRVFVSEIMLQQTQVSRVVLAFPKFVDRYPSFRHLARARTSTLIRSWKGMGYNNRALRLQRAARRVMSEFHGALPQTIAELRTLPGVGPYTAHAIACFAFGKNLPVVDTNISRVLRRLDTTRWRRAMSPAKNDWSLAQRFLPGRNAGSWHQALMDFGSMVCTAISPKCSGCPLEDLCPSAHQVDWKIRRRSKSEPGRKGVPNRIYRGRVVERLRSLPHGKSMDARRLGREVLPGFSPKDSRWFLTILASLEKDGLIHRRGNQLSLPQ